MKSSYTVYSAPTGNGRKPIILLEEMGIEYDYHPVDISKGEQFKQEYVKLNPNSKIPTLVDHSNNDFVVFESGAILLYLAEKHSKFIPEDTLSRSEVVQWLFFQNAGIGPMFGQFGHFFKLSKEKCDHPYPLERYTKEAKRLLLVLDSRLSRSEFIGGAEYSIADISTFPWVDILTEYLQAQDYLELESYHYLHSWLSKCKERKAVVRAYERLSLSH
ncbi:MAG: glutathione S-transferase N-terminal domain-containing protein [Patescibacteria group bacterium]